MCTYLFTICTYIHWLIFRVILQIHKFVLASVLKSALIRRAKTAEMYGEPKQIIKARNFCKYKRIFTYIFIIYTYVYTYVHTCLYLYVHMSVNEFCQTRLSIYIYIYIFIYTYVLAFLHSLCLRCCLFIVAAVVIVVNTSRNKLLIGRCALAPAPSA